MGENMINKIWNSLRKKRVGQYLTKNKIALKIMSALFSARYGKGLYVFHADNYKILIDRSDGGVARRYLLEGEHERFEKSYVKNNVRFKRFIDIGANIGDWTFFVAANFPDVEIFSFEPHPVIFGMLSKSASLNGFNSITIKNIGLGDCESNLDLMCDAINQGNNSLIVQPEELDGVKHTVNVKRFDSIFGDLEIDENTLIKIDVQGYEKYVLEGISNPITLSNAQFLIEIDEYTPNEIYDFILNRVNNGSNLTIIDEYSEQIISPVDLNLVKNHLNHVKYFDLLIS